MNPKHQDKSPEKKSGLDIRIKRHVSGQERVEETLSNSDSKFHFLFKSLSQGVVHQDANGRVIDANPAAQKILGLTLNQLQGRTSFDPRWKSIHEDGSEFSGETHPAMLALQTGKSVSNVVMGVYNPAIDEQCWININAIPRFHPVEKTPYEVYTTFEDITERRQAEKQLIQMKRLYATLSHVNESIVRAKDRADLYQSICRVAVKFGEFSLAWVGLLDNTSKQVISVAADGQDGVQWPFQTVDIEEGALKDELVATAIRTSKVATSDDIRTDTRMQSLRDQLSEHDYHSSAVIPFRLRGRTIGVVNLISREVGLFKTESEALLLEEMGGDISFALDTIENETEHMLAEEQFRKSEERFRSVFDNMLEGVQILGFDWRYLYLNQSAVKHSRRPSQELLGNVYMDMWPGVESTRVFDMIKCCMEEQIPCLMETEFVYPDGIIGWFELSIQPVPEGTFILSIDITERKQAEQKLRKSEERYRLISENAADVIWVLDPAANKFTYVSPSVEKLRGYTSAEVMAQPVSESLTSESLKLVGEALAENLPPFLARGSGTESFVSEVDQPHKNGSIVNSEVTTTYLFNEHGKVEIVGVSRDITQRKQAENKLQTSERTLKLFVEYAPAAIAMFDRDMKYIAASRRFLTDYNLKDENIIGRSHYEIFPEISEHVKEIHRRCLAGATEKKEEDSFPRMDGTLDWVRWEIHPWYEKSEEIGGILLFSEVFTERKQAEEKLKESERDLQNFINNSPDTIYVLDLLNHSSRFLNREEFLGYSKQELELENSIMSAIHPEDFAVVAEQWKEMTTTAENHLTTIQYRVKNKKGRLEWIQQRTTVLARAENGSPQKLLITLTIVTEHMLADQERRILAALVEESPDFIGTAALDGQVKYVNQGGRALVGLQDADVTQLKINEFAPSDTPVFGAALQEIKSSGHWQGEGELVNFKTNTRLPVQIQVFVIPHPQTHQPMAIGTVMQNISERRQAQKKIQLQMQRMSALSKIDRAISSSLDMRLSLDVLLDEVLSQLGVDAASVLLLNTFSQTLEYVAGKGFRTLNIRHSNFQLGEGLVGWAGLERKVLHIPNLAEVSDQFKRSDLLKTEGFVEYFGVPLIAKGVLKGVLEIFHRTLLDPDLEWLNYLETLGGQAAIAIDNVQLFEGIQQSNRELITAYDATITGWSHAMDMRDKETEGHTLRVTELTVQLAKKMCINQQEIVQMRRGALLHDIGKLGVPDNILLKPDKLSPFEWAVMRQHPSYAYKMLLPIVYLQPALDIPYCHHEKWDGSGYPRGLKGEEIPLAARLFAIIDVWDALRSDRPYRAGWTAEKTRVHIIEGSGTHFDPQVVEAFLSLLDESPDLR